MSTKAGLWIDHKQAVIVSVTGETEDIKVINSELEKPVQSPADDAQQRVWTEHLNRYYDAVIAPVHNVKMLFLMGPGEAKGELKRRLERTLIHGREIEIEAADKMTEPQIAAKVREHFLHKLK
jgi:hypothetical protein